MIEHGFAHLLRHPTTPMVFEDDRGDLIVGAGRSKVILCVLPATADLVTQEALAIARDLDTDATRTVGVITKIDEAPYNVRSKLEPVGHHAVSLKLGLVAVGLASLYGHKPWCHGIFHVYVQLTVVCNACMCRGVISLGIAHAEEE